MGRKGRIILGVTGAVVVLAGAGAVLASNGKRDGDADRTVTVRRADLVAKALAVGTIEPETEVGVKSKVSGVVRRAFADEGDLVHEGDPLLEIRPDPTPLELVEARRALEMRGIEVDNLKKERERKQALSQRNMISQQDLDAAERQYKEASLQYTTAHDRLELLEKGRVTSGDDRVESVVRSPITGYVLQRMVEVGDPVVPLSTYQEGTVLMTMANMDHLLFRGTVDEIDVGRLREGMPVTLSIGALPGAEVQGTLTRISLKAKTEQNATVFPVEIAIDAPKEVRLRAGFSANANIIVDERHDVLVVPERVVTFEGDSAWVTLRNADGTTAKHAIVTGLSDAINTEVLNGLKEGDVVMEKPLKTVGG
ncbi:MAG TPA: efflux RND transporter periplasmic adaptor subunit [Longimicrobiales bacterium]|nr:efflux RND transporter periplasmic adaptor subunit [Longimicrobiales bacterium]